MVRKKELLSLNQHKISRTHPAVKHLDEMELFRTFKKYDRNSNGTLSFSEYAKCLEECATVELSKQEIITSSLSADLNHDGCIDFEEFMKHFSDFMNMLNLDRQLK